MRERPSGGGERVAGTRLCDSVQDGAREEERPTENITPTARPVQNA